MENTNLIIVFIEGLLSIFSPCILPIIPIYIGMLSNSTVEDLEVCKINSRVLIKNTIFFILGISITFFILGSSITLLGSFLNNNRNIIMLLGGILIVFMSLFYLEIINFNFLNKERRINYQYRTMTPITAFILGFTFSFGWTPCIGPILASVLVMASSMSSIWNSMLLIGIYTIGFVVPFLIVAVFYNKLYKKVNHIRKYMGTIKKLSGIMILIVGIIMTVNGFSNIQKERNYNNSSNVQEYNKEESNNNKEKVPDITLIDQYGEEHKLSDYKGKKIFLNFWATWCPPCKAEMPYIEELYNEYGGNKEDVIILGVATPNLGREGNREHIESFLNDNNYKFPVVFDEDAQLILQYRINAFPTTFIINKEGYIEKQIPGAMNKETMKELIESVN